MRKVLGLFITLGLLVPAIAFAAVIQCDGGDCEGTKKADQITGSDERDKIYGKDGDDEITTPSDSAGDWDRVEAGSGNDTISDGSGSPDPDSDVVYGHGGDDHIDIDDKNDDPNLGDGDDWAICNKGVDTVIADPNDTVTGDCEHVTINDDE